MTDIERLIAAGEALYGRTWQAQLSDLLEIDPRRIRQWVDGSRPISHGIWLEISYVTGMNQSARLSARYAAVR